MELVDNKVIEKFSGELKKILELELMAGNRIQKTFQGDWPLPDSIMIILNKPFKLPIQKNLKNIEFCNINDPNYWKAHYFDCENKQYLCCGFDGPNF
ncbi:MAG: hypothetical protein LIR50_01040 [Bacillota bacterium]|nr:hypothetical protein [Bacillota bacterium]